MFLGIADENTTFPTVLSCPICTKATLHCYDDTPREDVWLTCDTCSAHGNIITFAAQIWKIDLPQTIARFDGAGLCASRNTPAYVNNLARAHNRELVIEKFWEAAKTQLWTHDNPNIASKLRDFGVSKDIDCSQLVGVVYSKQIEKLCKTVARGFPAQLSKDPCIALPYHDLPGRLSGFLLYQYGEDLTQHKAFIGMTRHARYMPDAGYYLMNTAQLPVSAAFNNSFFILDDPLWVLRAQAAQLWHGSAFLPLCASYDGKEARSHGMALQMFPHTQRFFVGRTLTPALVTQASAARGYVAVPPDRVNNFPGPPRHTLKLLADMRRSAVTWQTALETVFKTNTSIAAQTFTAALQIPRERVTKFLQTRTTLSQLEINKVLERMRPNFGVDTNKRINGDVIERDDCWYTTTGMRVVNCAPVISKVIYTDEEKYYDGYVKKDGNTYDFFAPAVDVDKHGLLNFLARDMAKHGELITVQPGSWNAKSLQTSLLMHQAEVLALSTEPGWHAQNREFCFRDYTIKNDGSIAPALYPELCANNPLALPEPSAIAPSTLAQLLTPAHENATLWALVSVALAGMVAPVLDVTAAGFAVDTLLFKQAQTALTDMGCRNVAVGIGRFKNTKRLANIAQTITWPTLITNNSVSDGSIETCILAGLHNPGIMEVLPQTLVTAASFGWHCIAPNAKLPSAFDGTSLRFIVPAYIQHVLRDRIITQPGVSFAQIVVGDLHKWLNTVYGQTFNLDAASRLIVRPAAAHLLLMHDVNTAINNGELALLPHPRQTNQKTDFIIRNKQHWWINKKAVTVYLHNKTGIAPNWAALLNCFVQQGVFSGEKTINNLPGFLLDKSWCDDLRAGNPDFVAQKYVG